jgi:alpha-tubulin suppressor-like RCC1 family protein
VGDTTHRSAPTLVPDLQRVVKVRGGAGHTLAVTADGDVIAFGKVRAWHCSSPQTRVVTRLVFLLALTLAWWN